MTIHVKIEAGGEVAFDGDVESFTLNRDFGANLAANVSLKAVQQRGAARGGGANPGLGALADKLKQASKDGIEQAQANAAAAPPA